VIFPFLFGSGALMIKDFVTMLNYFLKNGVRRSPDPNIYYRTFKNKENETLAFQEQGSRFVFT
jgi:hypothetical protein